MPHNLTDRQQEYLDFIREYIKRNECAPRLNQIAAHFHVTSPTATKALKVLQEKGALYFDRDKNTGFYIRTPERFTSEGSLREIMITGVLDRYGEVHQFPENHGHFPLMLPESTGDVFALEAYQHIPSAGILARDRMIFTNGGEAKPGDICIYPWGDRWFLIRVYDLIFDEELPFFEMALPWEDSLDEIEGRLFWWPLTAVEGNGEYFAEIVEEQQVSWFPISPDQIVGKAVQLVRRLAI